MKKQIEVQLPSVPNFLKVGEIVVDLGEFSEEELIQIGKEWTEKLIEISKSRRSVNPS